MITTEEIKKLAHLARIEVTDTEVSEYAKDFEAILGYIDQINTVEITEIENPILQKNIVRIDEKSNPSGAFSEIMIEGAPESQDGFYKVPKIL